MTAFEAAIEALRETDPERADLLQAQYNSEQAAAAVMAKQAEANAESERMARAVEAYLNQGKEAAALGGKKA